MVIRRAYFDHEPTAIVLGSITKLMSFRFGLALSILLAPALLRAQHTYPEGAPVPRFMTAEEFFRWRPAQPAATAPPTGPIHCPAEYEPMEGLQISWEGSSSWLTILAQVAKEATSADGDGIVYIAVDTPAEQTSASATLTSTGVDLNKVRFIQTTTDTIWCRDYGPRYIYEGGCRAIIDHVYNRPRPNDDNFPFVFSALKHHAIYGIPLIHGGGNFHLDALNRGYATRLINNENPDKTEAQILQLWLDYQNLNVHLFDPFPTSVDSTQHLDMWMQLIGDHAVVISDWPEQSGSTQDLICDSAAGYMASQGYTVTRVPAKRTSTVHYTYTNVVMCNGVVMVPSYTNSLVSQYNAPALAAWQQACPDKRIVQINCEPIISSAGAIHCIVMHIPKPLNGTTPSAYLKTQNGDEMYLPRQQVSINWITDDDEAVTQVDLHYAVNGGQSWRTIVTGIPDSGNYVWTVPPIRSQNCKLRVTAKDSSGNAGSDVSDGVFSITSFGLSLRGPGG